MLPWMLSNYSRRPTIQPGTSKNEARLAAEDVLLPLQKRVESLELACAGLWELLKKSSGMSDEDLVAAIQEVDLRDGQADGKISRSRRNCPSCGRPALVRNSESCSWCGADLPKGVF